MNLHQLKHVLANSTLCFDNATFLDWCVSKPKRKEWSSLFFRFTPAVLENAAFQPAPLDARGRLFSAAVSYFRVGNVCKTTCCDRTVLTDAAVCALAQTFGEATVMEVGVSDGSSSIGLLRCSGAFRQLILTDRNNQFFQKRCAFGREYFDSDKRLFCKKIGFLYIDLRSLARQCDCDLEPIETANPVLRESFGIRRIERFDVFLDKRDPPVQIIKCANLLNLCYFPVEEIRRAVTNLSRSLVEGGYLVISQNNSAYRDAEAFFVFQKSSDALALVQSVNDHDVAASFMTPFPV